MKLNKDARRSARRIFKACFENSRLEENRVRKAFEAISKQKPRGYIGILSELVRLVQHETKKHSLHVESATHLDGSQLEGIQSKIQTRFPQPLKLSHTMNPALIGGLRVKIGSNVWDGSIAARLNQLKNF